MGDIGIRDLKARASEIVRTVKERRERYVITRHGRPAALLIPIEEATAAAGTGEDGDRAWNELLRLGREIATGWQDDKSSVELLSESRR